MWERVTAQHSIGWPDVFVGFVWLACNVVLVKALWQLIKRYFPADSIGQRILHTSVAACASILTVLIVLGAFRCLSGVTMLVSIGILASGMLLVSRPEAWHTPSPRTRDSGLSQVTTGSFWVVLFCLFCGHVTVHGLLRFPTDFDTLMYHLPLIDHWLQARSLYVPQSAFWSHSANSELLGAWMTGAFSGDFMIALNNLPVVVVWTSAGIEILRQCGLPRKWRDIGAATMLCVHTTLHETDDASNDLMVVAFCLATAAYTLRWFRSHSRRDLVLLGISLGVLAGTKYFAVGYAVVCVGVFGVAVVLRDGWISSLRTAVLPLTAAAPCGVYWYLRNWFVTGLPLYPMGVAGATEQMLYPNVWGTTFAGNDDPMLLQDGLAAVWKMGGPVHLGVVVLLPALVVFLLIQAVRLRRLDSEAPHWLVPFAMALWLAGSALVFLLTPFAVEDQPGTLNHLHWAYTPVRYGLCFLSFGTLSFYVSIHVLSRRWTRVNAMCLALLCIATGWQAIHRLWSASEYDFLTSAIVGISCMLVFELACLAVPWMSLRSRLAATLATGAALAIAVGVLSPRWHEGYADHFNRLLSTDAFRLIERKYPKGTRICVLDSRPYPFFGSYRQNTIVQPRSFRAVADLRRILGDHQIVLVVAKTHQNTIISRYRGAHAALSGDSRHYRLLSQRGRLRVYRVRP